MLGRMSLSSYSKKLPDYPPMDLSFGAYTAKIGVEDKNGKERMLTLEQTMHN